MWQITVFDPKELMHFDCCMLISSLLLFVLTIKLNNYRGGVVVPFNLSINHYICGDRMSFPDFAATAARSGARSVGLTRAAIREMGIKALKICIADHGLSVSSLNSSGYFTGYDPNPVQMSNEALVDAAAELEAPVLCVIAGRLGNPPMPLAQAHGRVIDGFALLAERAAAAGVSLGLEPIYPGDVLTKGCINSCAHGLEIVHPHNNGLLILDLYHSWWDPGFGRVLYDHPEQVALIQLCNIRIAGGLVTGRTPLREGVLNLAELLKPLDRSEFAGTLELELFSHDLKGYEAGAVIEEFPKEALEVLPARLR